jgi:hypothetical protein
MMEIELSRKQLIRDKTVLVKLGNVSQEGLAGQNCTGEGKKCLTRRSSGTKRLG